MAIEQKLAYYRYFLIELHKFWQYELFPISH